MHCRDGNGGGGKQHSRISPEPTDGSCCRGGAPWCFGDTALCPCPPWEPSRDGAAEPPEMGKLAGMALRRGLSLYGTKCAAGGGNRAGSISSIVTSQEPGYPSQALTCLLSLWMGVPRVGSQASGHCPNPRHRTAASGRFLFKEQLTLFLPFHSFPSAAGTPSVSAGQQSTPSEFQPEPSSRHSLEIKPFSAVKHKQTPVVQNPPGAGSAQLLPPVTSSVFSKPQRRERISRAPLEKQPKSGDKESLFSERSPHSLKLGSSAERLGAQAGCGYGKAGGKCFSDAKIARRDAGAGLRSWEGRLMGNHCLSERQIIAA